MVAAPDEVEHSDDDASDNEVPQMFADAGIFTRTLADVIDEGVEGADVHCCAQCVGKMRSVLSIFPAGSVSRFRHDFRKYQGRALCRTSKFKPPDASR